MPTAIVHFEIHVADIARSQAFYERVFGWRVERWKATDYYGVWTGRSTYPDGSTVGIDGGLRLREGRSADHAGPPHAFVCTIETNDIDAVLEEVVAGRGAVLEAKHAVPGVGWQSTCADPDGNHFGLFHTDPSARSA